MGVLDQIFREIEEVAEKESAGEDERKTPAVQKPDRIRLRPKIGAEKARFELVGQPVTTPLLWDDLGLGMIRSFGFMPGKPIRLVMDKEKWTITGARANTSVIPFIAGGAGGLIYFLQDYLIQVKDWGQIAWLLTVILPILFNLIVRVKPIEFYIFEIEFFGYDPSTQMLILSTLTQPGGTVAMKLDLPADKRSRAIEEARLIDNLKAAYSGYINLNGLVRFDSSKLKQWSLWTLMAMVIFLLGKYGLR